MNFVDRYKKHHCLIKAVKYYEYPNEFKTHFITSSISFLRNLIWSGKYMTKGTREIKAKIEVKFKIFEKSGTSRLIKSHKSSLFSDYLLTFKRLTFNYKVGSKSSFSAFLQTEACYFCPQFLHCSTNYLGNSKDTSVYFPF